MHPRKTVLVAATSMSRLYMVDLVRELATESRDITVISYFRSPLFDNPAIAAMQEFGARVHQYAPRTHLQHLKARHDAYRRVRTTLQDGPTDLFHVHPTNFLTNWISFDTAQRTALDVHFNLIPDGLVNYYLARVAAQDRPDLVRRVGTALAGVRYYPNEGTILGLESVPYENYWYVGTPGIMGDYMPTRKFDVTRPEPIEPMRPDSLLFLGQTRPDHASEVAYRKLLHDVARLGATQVHYKPHPMETPSAEFTAFLRSLRFEVRLATAPAEQLGMSYTSVAGVLSSALVNLTSLGWHDSVYGVTDAVALADLTGRGLDEARQMSDAATRLGIASIALTSPKP